MFGASAGRVRRAPQSSTTVESWGVDPVGSDQLYGILHSVAAPLLNPGTPIGWGIAGSDEQTNTQLWASPQAFTGAGALTAHTVFHEGGGTPVIYNAESDYSFDTVTIPDQVT